MRIRISAVVVALIAGLLPVGAGAQDAAADTAACPADVPAAGFRDVAADAVHRDSIDCVVWWEIARGTSPRRYRPAQAVTREQSATFVARLVLRSEGSLPASPTDRFRDDDASRHHYSINRLAAADVLEGSGRWFRPEARVRRGQMATLLVNAYEHRTGTILPAGSDHFRDDATSVHERNINKAAEAGFAGGISGARFDPNGIVTRAQMASFVTQVLQAVAETGQVHGSPATRRAASALETYDECNDLLGHLKEHGTELVGAWGWGHGYSYGGGGAMPEMPADGGGDSSGGGESGGGGEPAPQPETPDQPDSHSGTNNQEDGVDESDIVKTDGTHIFAINGRRLRAIDVSGSAPQLVDSIRVAEDYGAEMLQQGTKLLVLATEYGALSDPGEPVAASGDRTSASSMPYGGGEGSRTVLTIVDAANPSNLRIEQVLQVDGATLTGRMIDGIARIVTRADPPALEFIYPDDSDTSASEAAQHNRRVVEESRMADWLPRFRVQDHRSGEPVVTEGPLLGCRDLRLPPEFSGLGTINVLTVNPEGDLTSTHAASVLAAGETVYASPGNLYVATTHWGAWAPEPATPVQVTTEVHAFALDDPSAATYRASGEIAGTVLNQFSLSEHDGHLRVATTLIPSWWGDAEEESESVVSVLQEQSGALAVVGSVGGLGRGEQIYAVRFMGDVGYVVTFRQTDPLYTLDLTDPTAPRVVGELKIEGYSAYLHPAGDGRLLGVGQDADTDGRTRGTQISLFDVSNPASPRRIDQQTLGEGSYSDVEFDHRAFLLWPATGTLLLPFSRFTYDEESGEEDYFVGAAGFAIDASTISPLRQISHGDPAQSEGWPAIYRSIVVGDVVYTLSEIGLLGSDVRTLEHESWLGFD